VTMFLVMQNKRLIGKGSISEKRCLPRSVVWRAYFVYKWVQVQGEKRRKGEGGAELDCVLENEPKRGMYDGGDGSRAQVNCPMRDVTTNKY